MSNIFKERIFRPKSAYDFKSSFNKTYNSLNISRKNINI